MKKINVFELLSIGIIILIGCFIISFAANELFEMESDFLSASATFFAGVVAYKLFNDWRTQYRTELLERLKDRFCNLLINLEEAYTALEFLLIDNRRNYKDPKVYIEVYEKIRIFRNLIENIQDELDFYQKLYIEFNLNKYKKITPPKDMIDGLSGILQGISLTENHKGDDEEYLENLNNYFKSRDASNKIVGYKIDLSHDLHIIIIDMITDKKGQ